MKLLKKCLGILYPQTCCFCGKVSGTEICPQCFKKIEYVKEPVCKKCGKPILNEEKEICDDCERYEHFFEQGKSIWIHKGVVRRSLYQFKYHNRRIYGKTYGKELFRLYGQKIKDWGIDVIIPVPLHKKRRRKRGYNQSEIIAHILGKLAHIPVDTKSVRRVRHTKPQKELNHKERRQNVKHAFAVNKQWKVPQNVLIVDDIYTTGNTVDEIAKLIKEKGVQKVFFLTISIGQGF